MHKPSAIVCQGRQKVRWRVKAAAGRLDLESEPLLKMGLTSSTETGNTTRLEGERTNE